MIWTDEKIKFLIDNYKDKEYQFIANVIGTTTKAVKNKCQRLKLIKRPINKINEKFFDKWSSDSAYIFGFLMADGCVEYDVDKSRFCVTLCIHRKDIEIVDFINNKLGEVSIIDCNGKNENLISVRYTSRYMCEKLISLGLIPRKTGYESMEKVPQKFIPDFIRGFFDGDGCIYSHINGRFQAYICSQSYLIISQIMDYFNFGILVERSKYNNLYKKQFYTWEIRRKCDLDTFKKVIYYNNNFCLKRKYHKITSVDTIYKIGRNNGTT